MASPKGLRPAPWLAQRRRVRPADLVPVGRRPAAIRSHMGKPRRTRICSSRAHSHQPSQLHRLQSHTAAGGVSEFRVSKPDASVPVRNASSSGLAIVVAVEETTFVLAVQRSVNGVEDEVEVEDCLGALACGRSGKPRPNQQEIDAKCEPIFTSLKCPWHPGPEFTIQFTLEPRFSLMTEKPLSTWFKSVHNRHPNQPKFNFGQI
jgi:hypothetical protein